MSQDEGLLITDIPVRLDHELRSMIPHEYEIRTLEDDKRRVIMSVIYFAGTDDEPNQFYISTEGRLQVSDLRALVNNLALARFDAKWPGKRHELMRKRFERPEETTEEDRPYWLWLAAHELGRDHA